MHPFQGQFTREQIKLVSPRTRPEKCLVDAGLNEVCDDAYENATPSRNKRPLWIAAVYDSRTRGKHRTGRDFTCHESPKNSRFEFNLRSYGPMSN